MTKTKVLLLCISHLLAAGLAAAPAFAADINGV